MVDASYGQSPQRQLPWDERLAVVLPPSAGFAPHEHWAWARIIRGEWADMRYFPQNDPAAQASGANGADDGAGDDAGAAENWPAHRRLSSDFMYTILFREPWKSARARPHVRIRCAQFAETLDWENEDFNGELHLYRCHFMENLNWLGLRMGRSLILHGSRIESGLNANRLVVQGSLLARAGFLAKGEISLIGARFTGNVEFDGATLEGQFVGDGLQVEGSLFFRTGFTAKEEIRLPGARIGRALDFSGATIASLNAGGLVVSGGMFFRSDFVAEGDIRLIGARTGVNIEFDGATLKGLFLADGLVVDGAMFLRSMKRLGDVDLLGAHIGQALHLGGSVVEGSVDLTGAVINGDVSLGRSAGEEPKWGLGEDVRLVLRNAKAGALAGGLAAFRRGRRDFVPCDLAGFTFDRLGGLGAGKAGSTLASAGGNELRAWLRRCRPKDHFDPAPYRALARGLREAGRADRAADVMNALGNYELVAPGTPALRRFIFLPLSWLLIGYGQRNHRAFMWFIALVLGAAVIGYWQDLISLPHAGPQGWRDWPVWFDWAGFAFGNAVPLVTLDAAHTNFLADRFCLAHAANGACAQPDVPRGLTGFFYTMKISGFVILSYLAAGLSGLAQRRD